MGRRSRSTKVASGASTAGAGCGILFGAPFACVGVGMIGVICWTLLEWRTAQGWVEVPCTIIDGGIERSEDTGQAWAKYQYSYEGNDFTGDRVGLHFGSDNIGSYQEDMGSRIREFKRSGESWRCFVDADSPADAILDRSLRWEMLALYEVFALVFGGVGFGIIGGVLWGRSKIRETFILRDFHPDEPWKWKQEWVEGLIPGRQNGPILIAAACYWNIVSLPMWVIIPVKILEGELSALIGLLFPAIGFWLAFAAVRRVLRKAKFGQSVLRLASHPGVLGGQLSGAVLVNGSVIPDAPVKQTLTCTKTTGSGEDQKKEKAWTGSHEWRTDEIRQIGEQTAIPVRFTIPYDLPPSEDDNPKVEWVLKVTASVPGVDFADEFLVPVFRTEDSSPKVRTPDDEPDDYGSFDADVEPDQFRSFRESGLKVDELPDGSLMIKAPLGRNPGALAGLAIIALIFDGTTAALFFLGAPWPFWLFFGLFSLLLTWCLFDTLLSCASLHISPDRLTYQSGWIGFRRERSVPRDRVRKFKADSNMSVGETRYYDITAETDNGRKLKLMHQVRGQGGRDLVKQLKADDQ